MNTKLAGRKTRTVGVSRLFRAGTKESRMTNAKQACTRSTGSASKDSWRGNKRGCWKGVHHLSYKELLVKNNTTLCTLWPRPRWSSRFRELQLFAQSLREAEYSSYSGTYLTVMKLAPARSAFSCPPFSTVADKSWLKLIAFSGGSHNAN